MSFGAMILAAWTALLLYVAVRTATVPAVARRVPRPVVLGATGLLWSTLLVGRHGRGAEQGSFVSALEWFGMHAFVAVFLCAVTLLAADILALLRILPRRLAPRLRGWALLAGAALTATAAVQGARPPAVRTHEVFLAGLPAALDGTRVVALSDFHLGGLHDGEWLAERAAQTEALRPDVVVLLGDIVEGHGAPPSRFVGGLERLRGRLGRFAVTGNHENHGGRATMTETFRDAGFTVLRDRWVEVATGLVIAGVDDYRARSGGDPGAGAVERALAGRPPGAAILLSHSPRHARRAAAAGAGLMLSGHTHGGQVWPFGLLVRRVHPLLAGRYELGGMTAIVSRGAGAWGARMRLWHRGDILLVILRAGGRPPAARG